MRNRVVSLRYARGLIKAAGSRRQQVEIKFQIERFLKLLSNHPEIKSLLLNQSLSPIDKEKILESLFKYLDFDEIAKHFIFLLIKKGRIEQIEEIFLCMQEEMDYQAGIFTAEVTVARELDPNQQKKLKIKLSELTGHPIKLNLKISPEIIGGAITKIGSIIYDGSIKQQLQKLRETMIEE